MLCWCREQKQECYLLIRVFYFYTHSTKAKVRKERKQPYRFSLLEKNYNIRVRVRVRVRVRGEANHLRFMTSSFSSGLPHPSPSPSPSPSPVYYFSRGEKMLSLAEWRDVASAESGNSTSQRCCFVGVSRSNELEDKPASRVGSPKEVKKKKTKKREMLLRRHSRGQGNSEISLLSVSRNRSDAFIRQKSKAKRWLCSCWT